MGLFGSAPKRSLAEIFPAGTPFWLVNGWIEGQVQSPATGAVRTLAKVEVSPVEDEENIGVFGVWGSLAEQIARIEPGELPLIVTLDNSTGLWRFLPHGEPQAPPPVGEPAENPEKPRSLNAVPEAHLDLEGGEADGPTPIPPAAAPVGTQIDPEAAEPPPPLPPAARPVGTPLDDDQTFLPGGGEGN